MHILTALTHTNTLELFVAVRLDLRGSGTRPVAMFLWKEERGGEQQRSETLISSTRAESTAALSVRVTRAHNSR